MPPRTPRARAPVRSPSPDISHKHIITRTESPHEQVLSRSRVQQASRVNSGLSFAQPQQLQKQLSIMEDKYRLLLRENYILNEKLTDYEAENRVLRGKLAMGAEIREEKEPAAPPDLSVSLEYGDKISELIEEIKRLQGKLLFETGNNQKLLRQQKQLRQQNTQLHTQNSTLRTSQMLYGGRKARSITYDESTLEGQLTTIKNKLNQRLDGQLVSFQQQILQLLQQLAAKVQRIDQKQREANFKLQSQIKSSFLAPKAEQMSTPDRFSSMKKSDTQYRRPIRRSRGGSDQEMKESMLQMSQKMAIYHNELESYIRQNAELKEENNRLKGRPETSCPMCPIHLKRIRDLQEQIARYKVASLSKVKEQEGDLLKEKTFHSNLNHSLQGYLDELVDIRQILSNKEVSQYIQEIENSLQDYQSYEEKIEHMQATRERMVVELKNKALRQSLELEELKKDNNLLKAEIQVQKGQIARLQEVIGTEISREGSYGQLSTRKHSHCLHSERYKSSVSEAIRKIQHLQQEISQTLQQ